jgi:excisionase family DNA binding protein
MNDHYSKMDVARLFRVSRMTVTRWLSSGQLEGIRVQRGKRFDWAIPKTAVDAMVKRYNKEGHA